MPFHHTYCHPRTLVLFLLAAGCGGDGDGDPAPPAPTLETIEVTPASPALFSAAPGNTVTLTVVAKDQDGDVIGNPGTITYASGNTAVATVSAAGVVTAVGAGTTPVTATATYGGVTRSGNASITVRVAPAAAGVDAQLVGTQPSWVPGTVDVGAGGEVTWTVGTVPHDINFSGGGAPSNVPAWADGSESRTFPTPGVYSYFCSIHAGMIGSVTVH
jgi:plastocyanin